MLVIILPNNSVCKTWKRYSPTPHYKFNNRCITHSLQWINSLKMHFGHSLQLYTTTFTFCVIHRNPWQNYNNFTSLFSRIFLFSIFSTTKYVAYIFPQVINEIRIFFVLYLVKNILLVMKTRRIKLHQQLLWGWNGLFGRQKWKMILNAFDIFIFEMTSTKVERKT